MSLLLIALASAALQADSRIRTEPAGPDAWRLTITADDETDPLRLAERLRPRAAELCGAAGYHFERYVFDLRQALADATSEPQTDSLTLTQDVRCGPTAPEPELPPAPVLSEADALALNPRLTALSDAYFAALDAGRYAEAFAMVDEEMTGGASLEDWTARNRARRDSVGATTQRQIGRLTWYSNPPGAPPGHYGAVDYVASHALQDECGYLIWHHPAPDADLRLTRQEATYLPHDLDEATRARMRQAYCILL